MRQPRGIGRVRSPCIRPTQCKTRVSCLGTPLVRSPDLRTSAQTASGASHPPPQVDQSATVFQDSPPHYRNCATSPDEHEKGKIFYDHAGRIVDDVTRPQQPVDIE